MRNGENPGADQALIALMYQRCDGLAVTCYLGWLREPPPSYRAWNALRSRLSTVSLTNYAKWLGCNQSCKAQGSRYCCLGR